MPGGLGKIVAPLVNFDADFSQAWVDGRIYEGLDHADALKRATCPMILLHANWVRHPDCGLSGAMDDDNAALTRDLAPKLLYKRIDSEHVIHSYKPELFVSVIDEFMAHLV